MSRKYAIGILSALMIAKLSLAQTQINLQNQGRDVDFSAATSTKPAQTGTSLPATCSPGAVFVSLSNVPGENSYICTSSNVWSLQSAGAGSAPKALSLSVTGNTLSIGANCGGGAPCNVRVGNTIFAFVNAMTATISAGSGTAYIYVSAAGVVTIGHNMTVACGGGCVAQLGITGFPADSYPLATWTANNGMWNQTGVDARATEGRDLVTAGNGLSLSSSGGSMTLSVPPQESGFAVAFRGSDVTPGITLYLTMPHACAITDWAITSDGNATIMLWRVPDGGMDLPTTGDSISANGFSLVSGTRIHSNVLTDLSSTAISAFDTFGVNLFAVGAGASHVEFYLGCEQ